jgi:type IV pilus secretin PilQ/predicted competence protein
MSERLDRIGWHGHTIGNTENGVIIVKQLNHSRSSSKRILIFAVLAYSLLTVQGAASRAIAADNPGVEQVASGSERRLTLNFHQSDINEILSALALQQKVNIVTSNEVEGKVSVHLYDVTLKQALQAVASSGGYRLRQLEDVYYVYKPGKNTAALEGQLQMRIFRLRFTEIDKIENVLAAIPDIRMVKMHEPTRTIIVEDTAENIARIETIINHWDTPPRQVLIEAKILEITLTDDMTLGVNWEQVIGDGIIGTGGFSSAIMPTDGPVSPIPETGSGVFANVITGVGTSHQFRMALDALRNKTNINTLSTPKILALHGKAARVQVGGQQGYKVTTTNVGVATESIEFIDTGTILDITPYIDEKNNVLLNVKPTINTAKIEEGGIPVVSSTVVSTWMMARNTETVLIGGLIQEDAMELQSSIPCLGDIPGIGYLFGRKFHGTGKSELVVLITPTILPHTGRGVQEALEKTHKVEQEIEKQKMKITPYRILQQNTSGTNDGTRRPTLNENGK